TSNRVPADSTDGLNGRPLLAVSADGRWAYISGLRSAKADNPAVFRAPLPERAPATPFFGDPLKPGKDQTSLGGAPRGLAADGKGHLLVADPANRRVVVVAEADGKYAGEFAAEGPDCLAVDPASGAVYMTCTGGKTGVELVKLSGWKDPKELARLPLHTDGNPGSLPVIALDAGAKPPLVWFGTDGGTLLRIEDLGARFGEPRTVSNGNAGNSAYLDVSVDRLRKEVYTRCGTGRTWWWRFSEETGHVEKVQIPEGSGGGQGVCMVPAPDGNLYGLKWPYSLIKWDRAGKPLAWEAQENPETFINKEGKPSPVGKMPAHHKYVPVSETEIPHCLGVRWSDGHIFVLQPGRPGDRPPKALHEYLSSGKRVTTDPIIWKTSDAVLGPRFDAAGNIYIAEHVTPKDWAYPPELQKVFGPVKERLWGGPQHENAAMYGSIVKFSPKGGMVHAPMDGPMGGYNPFDGEPKLDPALKATELVTFADGLLRPIKVTGAEWVHPGISHAGVHVCTCENVTFDVDEFGRVFAPDLNLFQVRVIDTNGNALTRFGGYGNADSPSATLRAASEKTSSGCDPESKDKALANPEIAFAWLVGVGATDRYVYTGDSINRRMLRSKIVYAAEESCTVQ
ncbi:MAG TPA: hypothetical protein PK280_18740, partial [Planctomycetota bacterium]|nr:hypothetical protein [Planctomycetota bacterium]